jgi:N-methylhydantoinase A/oxoprolinase/acetone carboxylase beta subunit
MEHLVEQVCDHVERLKQVAFRDMRGEGFKVDDVQFELILEGKTVSNEYQAYSCPLIKSDSSGLRNQIETWLSDIAIGESDPRFEILRLRAWVPISHYQFVPKNQTSGDLEQAKKSVRTIGWKGEVVEATIYHAHLLEPGHKFQGPAIIESDDTTIMVPPNAWYHVDQYRNGILEV